MGDRYAVIIVCVLCVTARMLHARESGTVTAPHYRYILDRYLLGNQDHPLNPDYILTDEDLKETDGIDIAFLCRLTYITSLFSIWKKILPLLFKPHDYLVRARIGFIWKILVSLKNVLLWMRRTIEGPQHPQTAATTVAKNGQKTMVPDASGGSAMGDSATQGMDDDDDGASPTTETMLLDIMSVEEQARLGIHSMTESEKKEVKASKEYYSKKYQEKFRAAK